MSKQILLLPLLELFIRETKNGKRRKQNGERILPKSINNYAYTLKHLKGFEDFTQKPIYITTNIRNNQRLIVQQQQYWKKFYHNFSDYLLYEKGFYDNYVGSLFKILKCFFRYLKNDKYLLLPECYERFYVRKEEIRVIALLPEQYCFLILDKAFEASLSLSLRRSKELFAFGCTAALRYSDLRSLKVKNIESRNGNYYLVINSVKTDTPIQVKLPPFAVATYQKYAHGKKPDAKLFPTIAVSNFNKRLKLLGQKAGWTEAIVKGRTKNGRREEVLHYGKESYHFSDLLSAHLMRKTGITLLLMLGMPEHLVRKISGHSCNSKEFFRYVNFADSYITDELDKAHKKLLSLYGQ